MEGKTFVNYYAILELEPISSAKAITRKFHDLARRYHPDNQATGDRRMFDLIVAAHDMLKDPHKREQYHKDNQDRLPALPPYSAEGDKAHPEGAAPEATCQEEGEFIDDLGIDRDASIQNSLLTLLYLRRRRNIRQPGIGDAELERVSGCPPEHLEFHIWYLKAKGWISTGEDGLLAITVAGVDRAAFLYQGDNAQKLITSQN